MRRELNIFGVLAVAALVGGLVVSAPADNTVKKEAPAAVKPAPAAGKPVPGSIACQLNLKLRLLREAQGESLVASLRQNQKEWDALLPDQRERVIKQVYAFLQKNPDEQKKLLQQFTKLISMSVERQEAYRRRAEWLKVVVGSFTPEERKQLEQMTPADRAQKMLERRDDLVSKGKLVLTEPTPQPTP
jgi:acyl-CoA reductase-like NAD-dependent aldehyde dehydrogenase